MVPKIFKIVPKYLDEIFAKCTYVKLCICRAHSSLKSTLAAAARGAITPIRAPTYPNAHVPVLSDPGAGGPSLPPPIFWQIS